jgi:hypothetical protein
MGEAREGTGRIMRGDIRRGRDGDGVNVEISMMKHNGGGGVGDFKSNIVDYLPGRARFHEDLGKTYSTGAKTSHTRPEGQTVETNTKEVGDSKHAIHAQAPWLRSETEVVADDDTTSFSRILCNDVAGPSTAHEYERVTTNTFVDMVSDPT